MLKNSKLKLSLSLLSCSLVALGAVAVVTFATTSCSKRTPTPAPDPLPTSASSYYTLASDPEEKHYFTQNNTPISNFCGVGHSSSVTIEGINIDTNKIQSLTFGGDYSSETSIGDYFLDAQDGHYSNLTSINFNGLSSLESVGAHWMYGYDGGFKKLQTVSFTGLSSLSSVGTDWMHGDFLSLTSIDFRGLSNLSSVGEQWMYCSKTNVKGGFGNMKDIYVGQIEWKNGFDNDWFAYSFPSDGFIHATTEANAAGWKKGGISNWSIVITE